jgi:hypothetical protein
MLLEQTHAFLPTKPAPMNTFATKRPIYDVFDKVFISLTLPIDVFTNFL